MIGKIYSLLLITLWIGAVFLQNTEAVERNSKSTKNQSVAGKGDKIDKSTLNNAVSLVNPIVRFRTNLGIIDVELLQDSGPLTVANFLSYVNGSGISRNYNQSFIHRSVANFVIQGGGYKFINGNVNTIFEQPPVINEFSLSNVRGTLAMAKLSGDPNSATSQWFFNTVNNLTLDTQNGGYTVFGRVLNDRSLATMDRIAAVPTFSFEGPFVSLPLINYTSGNVADENFVTVFSITMLTYAAPGAFDFDGDGRADLSVFRSSDATWYVNPSGNSSSLNAAQFGLSTDSLAPADYDGDGKTDIAVYRNGAWFILRSSNTQIQYAQFGLSGDVPVASVLFP